MAIQGSVNALMQQLYTIGAISAGLKSQKEQTKASVASAPSFPERFRKAFNIDDKAPLTKEYEKAIKWGILQEKRTGILVDPSKALNAAKHMIKTEERRRAILDSQRAAPEVKNEIAKDLARGSVESRTDSINQAKADFNAHTASLIKYYSKGSGNP